MVIEDVSKRHARIVSPDNDGESVYIAISIAMEQMRRDGLKPACITLNSSMEKGFWEARRNHPEFIRGTLIRLIVHVINDNYEHTLKAKVGI